jgi:hypothetical protein
LMTTGSALRSALAAMIAPRKLQSFAAAVHAVAPALSSVRSTLNVVVSNGVRAVVAGLPAPAWIFPWMNSKMRFACT